MICSRFQIIYISCLEIIPILNVLNFFANETTFAFLGTHLWPLSVYAQMHQINAHSKATGLSLHLNPYFVYASSEGSGESAHVRKLAEAFTVH